MTVTRVCIDFILSLCNAKERCVCECVCILYIHNVYDESCLCSSIM